jgi:VWFA-related protein
LVLMHNDFDWSQVVVTLPITIDPSNLNDVNPHFSDAALHLSSTSAVIDAGDDGAPALPATDMDGDARIIGAHVDIGADEYNGSPPTQHTLTVDKLGTGGGTVTSNPAGIDCGTTCSATFGAGDTVKLTAAPDPSSTFAGWSGACSGTGDCTVTMNRDLTVTATFDLPTQTHTLTINKDGTGDGIVTSDPQGIDCDPDCSEAFGAGDTVKLTAAPDPSSTFVGWSGACSGTGDCPVTMNSDLTVTATFDRIRHTLTVEKKGSGSGTVVSSGGVIDCGSTCSATFDHGQSVDLTASADNGSVFAGWSGCDADNGNVCSVVMNSDRLVTATFTDSTPTPCATMTIHQTDTSSCPDLRTILSIQDAQGQPVTGLTESNFLCSADQPYLEEDGMCQRVQLETGGSLAVSLVIDKSGSLSATDLDNIRQACIDFINLLSPGDSVAVYQFDSAVRLLQDYTTDLTLAIDAVNSIPAPGGSTALYDAIFAAAEHAEAASSRKGLVVLTDGQDNASLYTIDEAIERSIAAGVPVFTIGFGSADPVVLTEIADQTGGLYYDGVTSADLQDLLSRLGAVLSNQYVLLWDTAFPDGGVHSITVEAHWDSCTVSETATYDQAGSPCGASCMAERTLPMGYAAGSPAPVALAVRPDVDVQTYALEDIPPTGMAVSNISSGGLLDNGKVKWGPFFDNVDRDLSYEVTPPFSTQGSIGWGGVFSHDGIGEAICGDTLLPECPVHPADLGVSGDNWRIEINELTAYTTAWKLGDSWPRPPSPIPLSYAVNAGYLWQNGEDYHCDPFLDPPWDAGVTASSIQHMQGFVEAAQGSSHAVSSFDPDYYTPGIPVDVTLAVSPPASTQAYGVEETPPEGWAVTNISHNGTFNAQSNQIRWGIFDDDTPRDLTYRVTPPDSAVDAQSFFGQAAFDQQTELIGGQRTLLPSPCAGETLHIHDVTIPSGDDLVCSATESITLGPSVELESGSGLELQAGWGVTFSAPVHVRQGAALYIYTTTAP